MNLFRMAPDIQVQLLPAIQDRVLIVQRHSSHRRRAGLPTPFIVSECVRLRFRVSRRSVDCCLLRHIPNGLPPLSPIAPVPPDADKPLRWKEDIRASVDQFTDVLPVDKLHRDEVNALDLVQIENRADIRMIQRRRQSRFALEPLEVGFFDG